jgi:hypothetical protein
MDSICCLFGSDNAAKRYLIFICFHNFSGWSNCFNFNHVIVMLLPPLLWKRNLFLHKMNLPLNNPTPCSSLWFEELFRKHLFFEISDKGEGKWWMVA